MELKEIFDAMTKFDTTRKEASAAFTDAQKKLHADYGNGKIFDQKYKEARDQYTATVEAARKEGLEVVNRVFDALNDKVTAVVVAPAPADFLPTLEAIKAAGKNLSADEAALYIQKFGTNYTAYRSLVAAFEDLGVCKVYPVTYDKIKVEMNMVRGSAIDFFNERGASYHYRLLLADNNPLRTFAENISSFLNGNLLDYGKNTAEDAE